jgi:hypothetical protein
MKVKWQDPKYRAQMKKRDKEREELRKADPARFSRLGVPNGMRKDEANRLWAVAAKQADKVIQTLKDAGVLPSVPATAATVMTAKTATVQTATVSATAKIVVPETDDEMAEAVLRETFKLALGPTGARIKSQALATILKYTRLPPMSVLKLATGDAASALDEMVS